MASHFLVSRLVARAGHLLRMTYPALTPLTGLHPHGEQLAGVSLYDVEMKCILEPLPAEEGANRQPESIAELMWGRNVPS
jgi:predicted flavoprotein YhiN